MYTPATPVMQTERMTKQVPELKKLGKIKYDGSVACAKEVVKFSREHTGGTAPLARLGRGDTLYVFVDGSFYVKKRGRRR